MVAFFHLLSLPVLAADEIVDHGADETVGSGGTKGMLWDFAGNLLVGYNGKGTLTIRDGGQVVNTFGFLGTNSGSDGTVIVSGSGSTWENSDLLRVANSGLGRLTIKDGGTVTSSSGQIGQAFGSQGTVTVSGPGSTWNNLNNIDISSSGNGTLTIKNGGIVTSATGYIGRHRTFEGTVSVSGTGSTWENSQEIVIGTSGKGSLTIDNGGKVTSRSGYIGSRSNSDGSAIVSGLNSTWDMSSLLFIGDTGDGSLIITDGGKVTSGTGVIGLGSSSEGTMIVSGSGSIWESSGNLSVGNAGKGSLTITDGGLVTLKGSVGTVTVAGNSGSNGAIIIGADKGKAAVSAGMLEANKVEFGNGTGTIIFNHTDADFEFAPDVSGNGSIDVYSGFTRLLGDNSSYTGTMSLYGGTLSVDTFSQLGTGSLLLDGGTFNYSGTSDSTFNNVSFGANGGGFSVANKDTTLIVSAGLSGGGQLIKTGAGTLTLSGANTYSGSTSVLGGMLAGDTGSLQGDISVAAGAVVSFDQSSDGTYGDALSGGGSLIKIGAGALVLPGSNTFSGGTTLGEGTLEIGNNNALGTGTLTISGGTLATDGNQRRITNDIVAQGDFNIFPDGTIVNISAFELDGDISLAGDVRTITNSSDFNAFEFGQVNFGGVISNGGLTLKDSGITPSTNIVFFRMDGNASNTYSGLTTLGSNVSLALEKSGGATAIAGDVLVNEGAVVSTVNSEQIANGSTVTLQGNGEFNIGPGSAAVTETIATLNDDGSGSGVVNLAGNGALGSTLEVSSGTFSGKITGGGTTTASLSKIGSGVLALRGENDYLGETILNAGTLRLENKLAISAGTLTAHGSTISYGNGINIENAVTLTADTNFEVTNGASATQLGTISGTGSLTKTGAGTLTLSGANIYNGGTSVLGGTLSVDAFSQLGTGHLLLDGGNLRYSGLSDFTFNDFTLGINGGGFGVTNRDTTLTVSTDLSGSGQLTKTGAGTLKLTGNNSYIGGTDVTAGRLVGSAASIQGNLAISGGAAAEFYETGTAKFAGMILGEGKLIKTGAGKLTLSGNNMYSGGTDVEAGKLIGTAASIKGPLALSAGATVEFDQAIKGTFSGNISGEGKLIKSNTGELILTGINTYSGGTVITGGLISISDLAQLGSGEIILDGGTFQTTGDRTLETDDFDLGNAGGHLDIQGSGFKISGNIATPDGLLKTGQGKLLLDGTDNKIGKTTIVKAGALIIGSTSNNNNAKLETEVELENTAAFGGHGTLNGSVRNKGGVINPGNSVGTLTLTNYSGSGTLEIEVDSSDKANVKADKLIVSGTADFSQTALSLLFSPTSAQSWNIGPIEPLTIVELGGTAYDSSHEFKQVTGELSFLHTTLDYQGGDGNDIVLSLTRNDVGFADKALTPNQEATAQALEALGYGHTLYNAVITNAKTDKDAQQIFDQLSGEINASLRNVIVEDTLVVRQAVSARGNQHSFGTNQTGQSSASRNQYGFWAQGHGRWGTLDGNAETASISHQGGGMLMGMDVTTQSDLRLGAVFGYADINLEATGRQSSASAMSYTAGAYASYLRDGWSVSTGLANSWYDVDAERSISIANGLLTDELTSQQSLRALQGFGEIGYSFDLEPAVLQPFAGAAYVNLASNGFKETGKEPALTAQSQNDEMFFSTLGLRGKASFSVAGKNVSAHGMVAWQHASRDTVNFAQRFKGAADTFTITGAPIARDLALIETGLGMNVSESTNFTLSYSGQLARQSQNHGFNARMSVAF